MVTHMQEQIQRNQCSFTLMCLSVACSVHGLIRDISLPAVESILSVRIER